MTFDKDRHQLLELIKRHAYFREKITLSSGKVSDYYIDARRVTLMPEGVTYCARLILDAVKNDDVDAIGGPTLGADPMIGAIGVLSREMKMDISTFIIRKEAKAHGRGKQIEGPDLKPGARVIVIDDVATTGKAFLHSLEVLRSCGIDVVKAVCLVDRNEGAREALADQNCELLSLFDISEIHT